MRILLVTPPMTQVNTPYPATACLAGCLRRHAAGRVEVAQADLSIDLFLALFSGSGLRSVFDLLKARKKSTRSRGKGARMTPSVAHFLEHGQECVSLIDPVIRFLQGMDPTLAARIARRGFLPEGSRFAALRGEDDPLGWAFGALGTTDQARHLASLFVDDMADAVRDGIDPRFELSRYGEKLAASAAVFDPLQESLDAKPTLVDTLVDRLTRDLLAAHEPDLVGITIPFPGNVYAAFRVARVVKAGRPMARVVMGGGYVNTELRGIEDPRVFDYCDFMTLDDGNRPLLALIEHLRDPSRPLFRTFVRRRSRVVFETTADLEDLPHSDTGTPTYSGLAPGRYVSLFEMLNPMHRLWADGRWNKLTVARGCYFRKCTFCDLTLDHIRRYDPAPAEVLVHRIEALVEETGQTGFHLVDEAAPPKVLKDLARLLIDRRIAITWWGNIRFEKSFTPEVAALMARSGCIAVSGGLEAASDRLLSMIRKGVTIARAARVTRDFADAGILVHAYLMYGFPTETEQETVDSLEIVRQLFAEGCIQSGFWHRFAATVHSPIGLRPAAFGVRLAHEPAATFARNEVPYLDPVGCDHDGLGRGLRKAVYNFMHGVGLDADVRAWFDEHRPAPRVRRDLVRRALATR